MLNSILHRACCDQSRCDKTPPDLVGLQDALRSHVLSLLGHAIAALEQNAATDSVIDAFMEAL